MIMRYKQHVYIVFYMETVIVNLQIFLSFDTEVLKDRINELRSTIVNVIGELVYTMGFYNNERLNLFERRKEELGFYR